MVINSFSYHGPWDAEWFYLRRSFKTLAIGFTTKVKSKFMKILSLYYHYIFNKIYIILVAEQSSLQIFLGFSKIRNITPKLHIFLKKWL